MTDSAYINDCLKKRVIFFTGKGGVGKSTIAWSTAMACQRQGAKVTLASWNPYEAPKALDESALSERNPITWLPLETMSAFREYVLQIMKFDTIYKAVFDNHVLKTFIRAAPGLSETVIAGKIWDLAKRNEQDLLLVDLPSSGHAISFFQSPLGVKKLFGMGFVHKEAGKICDMFSDPRTRIDLVALPEELPLTESLQLKQKLEALHSFHFGFLHLNQCTPHFDLPPESAFMNLPASVQEIRKRYLAREAQEIEAQTAVNEIGLPTLKIPKLTTASMKETLQAVADLLGGC